MEVYVKKLCELQIFTFLVFKSRFYNIHCFTRIAASNTASVDVTY